MSEEGVYEVIVIGGGVIGSATSYYLSKEFGKKVLLLEQFDFLHRKGSSHGETRIIRRTYPEEHYTFLMKDAYQFWSDAEQEYGSKVYTKTGGIDMSRPDYEEFQSVVSSATKCNVLFEMLSPEEVSQRFPPIKLPEGYVALYSPDGGTLNATKAVAMFQSLARLNGCQMKDNSVVTRIEEMKSKDGTLDYIIVQVGPSQIFFSKKVIITTGAWTRKILEKSHGLSLPIQPKESTSSYWKVENPQAYSSDKFPVFITYGEPLVYGCPAREYPNMIKCAAHYGSDCDPDSRDYDVTNRKIEGEVRDFLQSVLTGVDPIPAMTESCMYTVSPDYGFIIDKIPSSMNIFIGCGFSGHGFKLAPVVGKILTQLAATGQHLYPEIARHFKLERFNSQ